MFKSLPKAAPKSQPDEPELSATQCDYYCAILEFAQGSFPQTIWENNEEVGHRITSDRDSFRLSVANTPTNIQTSIADPRPVVLPGRALHRALPAGARVHASARLRRREPGRGTRRLAVFAPETGLDRARRQAAGTGPAKFPRELRTYAVGLRRAMHRGTSDLVSKFEVLSRAIKAFDVVISEDDDEKFE
jgi:hypothetical protein